MSRQMIIRYRTRPEAADENSRLVEAVFASLAETKPTGFAYITYRLADGVSFVHLARFDGAENPLAALPAFAEFQRDLGERCAERAGGLGCWLADRRLLQAGRMTPATSPAAGELQRTSDALL